MKFQKILFVLAIAAFTLIGCKSEAKKEITSEVKEIVTAGETKQLAINISGMTCEIGCAKTIESKLSKQAGVLDAKVVFNDSIATVKYDASKTNKASLIAFVGGIAGGMYNATEASMKACTGKKSCATDCKKECCKGEKSCHSASKKACSKDKEGKVCAADCKKECCTGKDAKTCHAGTNKTCSKDKDGKTTCCTEKKACATDCKKECCA